MRIAALVLYASLFGCSTTATTNAPLATPQPGPASWQGPAADRMNHAAAAPVTPALKDLAGQTPLVYLTRSATGDLDEPEWELAVFDDGTLVYEGHRCVGTGGVLVTQLRGAELAGLRDVMEELCPDVGLEPTNDDELCRDEATTHVVCATRDHLTRGSDHCRDRYQSRGKHVDALVAALEARTELASWLGEPTRRLACSPGSPDLSPRDLARTIRADLTGPYVVRR